MEHAEPVVRITHLAAQDSDAELWLAHPVEALFDIGALNVTQGAEFRPMPASHRHGVALDETLDFSRMLIEQSLLHNAKVQAWLGERFASVPIEAFAGAGCVQCCAQIHTTEDSRPDRARILDAVSSFTTLRIQQRLDETLEIPPLPDAARRIVALQSNPNFDLSELVAIVETDAAIAAKIMSWANSAFYAADPPARSLDDAIMRILGFDLVMNLALGLVLSGTLKLPDNEVRGAAPLWLKSVFTAAAMEAIAKRLPSDSGLTPGSCYLAGLLCNFGTLVLGHVFPPQYQAVCRLQEANPQLPANIIDEHVMNLPREVLASTLFEQWQLPDELVTAVRHQHTADYAGPHATWVNLLQVAIRMLEDDLEGGGWEIDNDALAKLGLKAMDLEAVASILQESRMELESLARAVA
jgi:HD-like signal output (HDOD) protein